MPLSSFSVNSQSAGRLKISEILPGAHMSSARTEVVKMSLVDNWFSSFEKISAIAITDFMSGSFECPSSEGS